MAALRRIFGNWWVISLLIAATVLILFVILAPLVLSFFAHWWVRLSILLLVVLVWCGLAAWRIYSAKRASNRLEKKLGIETAGAEKEGDVLARRMREAVSAVKSEGSGKSLYARPWYVMIGPPGAGKTTALLNSGLTLPELTTAKRNVGGTRNIDFILAEEAVLLDTAGRYTTQDSDAARDSEAWLQLLDLLRTSRPSQPVNGVIVAIGLDELAQADPEGLERHAAIIETRLRELQEALKIEVPVYMLFTKADLVAGFSEFYSDLDVEGRRAVLGATLPWNGAVPAEEQAIAEHFDGLIEAVDARTAKRLQDEHDLKKRSLIVGFPTQLAAMRSRLLFFLNRTFAHKSHRQPIAFRGFYFTSGVQMGTPIDRVLGSVANLFDAPAAPVAGRGRAFFINRLLNEVVIGEAGLVRRSKAILQKERTYLIGGGAAIAAVSLLVLVLWTVSFFANRAWVHGLTDHANQARAEIERANLNLFEVRGSDADLLQAIPALQQLRSLPGGYAERHGDGHSFWAGFGLYQESLSRLAELTYLDVTQRVMLPRLMLRMEQRLRTSQSDGLVLYDTLKAYLMAGGQAPEMDTKFLKTWVANDWSSNVYPGPDAAPMRGDLATHLDAMLADPQFGQLWDGGAAPLDSGLVATARATVEGMTLSDRAYAILKQQASQAGGPDWRADTVLSPGAARAFANPQALMSLSVPFLFTRDGYTRAYQLALTTVQHDLEKDMWVLGPDQAKVSTVSSFQSLHQGVSVDYAREYIEAWKNVLAAMVPGNYFADSSALSAAVSQPSPIKLMLQEVARNTQFNAGNASKVANALAQRYMSNTVTTVGGMNLDVSQPNDAATTIAAAFASFNTYVAGSGEPSLDDFLAKLSGAARALAVDKSTNNPATATAPAAIGELKHAADMAPHDPPQLGTFLAAASAEGDAAQTSQMQTAASSGYGQTLLPACHSVVDNHYPFFGASAIDANTADLLPVFGSGSQFDTFINTQMRSYLNTAGPIWRWNTENSVASGFDPETPAQFQKIQALRDLLTTGVQARVEVVTFGGNVTGAEVFVGGTVLRFDRGQAAARTFLWTINAQPEARVTLYAGPKSVKQFEYAGTWAMFRLFDAAKEDASSATQFNATFGDGSSFVAFRVTLMSARSNPFSRAGLWSLRCPARL